MVRFGKDTTESALGFLGIERVCFPVSRRPASNAHTRQTSMNINHEQTKSWILLSLCAIAMALVAAYNHCSSLAKGRARALCGQLPRGERGAHQQ